MTDFEKYAISNGISSSTLNGYQKSMNGIISPAIVEERQMNAVTMDVFSKLISERIIVLGTAIDSDVANIICAQMMYLNSVDSESDIKLWLNSPGGSVVDGLAIYDVMNWVNCDVSTYTMGMAASMGSVLLSSGEKGKRYALPHSRVMIHEVSSGFRGKYKDIEVEYNLTKNLQNELYGILSVNTGKTIEQITEDGKLDKWFTAQEALEYGLIDEIIKKR